MSRGPVGFGDKIGLTDANLIKMTCRADGLLLQPSKPLTSIDAKYSIGDHRLGNNGELWSSYSTPEGFEGIVQHYMLAIDVNISFILQNTDFWPAMNMNHSWVYRADSNDVDLCVNGSNAFSGCVTALDQFPGKLTRLYWRDHQDCHRLLQC
jgi:hypothetical protein